MSSSVVCCTDPEVLTVEGSWCVDDLSTSGVVVVEESVVRSVVGWVENSEKVNQIRHYYTIEEVYYRFIEKIMIIIIILKKIPFLILNSL